MNSARPRPKRRRRGLSLLEATIATLLVGIVMVGAMRCTGQSLRGRMATADRVRGEHLARDLMTEILAQSYVDGGLLPLFGPEIGEPTADRTSFDDVDDYHGWDESPPRDRTGASIPNLSGWRRQVIVDFVTVANPSNVSWLETGLKRVTVRVSKNGSTIAKLVALRSREYPP